MGYPRCSTRYPRSRDTRVKGTMENVPAYPRIGYGYRRIRRRLKSRLPSGRNGTCPLASFLENVPSGLNFRLAFCSIDAVTNAMRAHPLLETDHLRPVV